LPALEQIIFLAFFPLHEINRRKAEKAFFSSVRAGLLPDGSVPFPSLSSFFSRPRNISRKAVDPLSPFLIQANYAQVTTLFFLFQPLSLREFGKVAPFFPLFPFTNRRRIQARRAPFFGNLAGDPKHGEALLAFSFFFSVPLHKSNWSICPSFSISGKCRRQSHDPECSPPLFFPDDAAHN